jgi:very-short-patch-repair endonuclease
LVAPASPKHNLALIAGVQRGRISANQLQLAGYSRQMIRTAVGNASLHRVHRGVYAVGHLAEIELGRETAALLATGPTAALVSITALELLKLIPSDPSRPVHLARQGAGRLRSRPGITAHTYRLLPSQIRIRDGLPVTSAERALLDAAPLLTPRQLERAFDEAIATRATSRTKVLELLNATSGRAGQASLAALADPGRSPGRTQSPSEERALELIRAAGLPTPEAQYPLHGFTADFYWPEAGVVFEVDGFGVHGLVRRNFVRDRRKDRVFRDHGLAVVRVAAEELEDQTLQIIAHLTRTITERTIANRTLIHAS